MATAPLPWELSRVDMAGKQIHLPVVLLGTAARRLVGVVFRKTAIEGATTVDLTTPGEPGLSYLPLRLGDIRGYRTVLHMYGFDTDARIAPMIAQYAAAAAGGILAFEGAPDDDGRALVASLARSVPPKTPVAALGPEEIAKLWLAQHDTPAVLTGAPDDVGIFAALKAVSREMLSALRAG